MLTRRVLLGVALIIGLTRLATATAQADPTPPRQDEVVVTGTRDSTEIPLLEILPAELSAYGASSLTDLLDALSPLTRSSLSDLPPVILINGRIAGPTELDNLPPEAILKVDVLPEKSALRYGLPDNQRVLNFILREHFRGLVAEGSDNQTTDGGGQSGAADAARIQIDHDTQSTLRLDYKESDRLLESERAIGSVDSDLRTLLPATNEEKIALTLAHPILGMRPSLEASVDFKSSESLQGLASDDGSLTPAPPPAGSSGATTSDPLLTQHTGTTTTHVAGRFSGLAGRFPWSAAATYDGSIIRTLGATGVEPTGAILFDSTDSNADTGGLTAYVGGPLVTLPAGAAMVNVNLTGQLQDLRSETRLSGSPATLSHLSRTSGSAELNGNLPLTSREEAVMPWLGDLALRFNAKVEGVSNFGLLNSWGAGVTWKPASLVHLNADFARTQTAPGLQDLLGPAVVTPGVQLFDFVTNETVFVTEVTGGDDDLRRSDTDVATFGMYLGPFVNSTSLFAKYEHRRVTDAAGPLPAITAAVESAFPERFIRDASGTLVEVDDRSVNLALEAQDDLKWGFNLALPFSRSPPDEAHRGFRMWLSISDTWYLRDTILLHAGLPELDLLNGAPLYVAGSSVSSTQPRHAVDLRATLVYRAFGARLRVRWRSATEVDGGDSTVAAPIYFSDLTTADLRVFADLGRGMRVNLGVTNLLDTRQSVHDSTGATPVGFQPGYLDPLGRVVTLSLRKVF
jgi:hypothetical protein